MRNIVVLAAAALSGCTSLLPAVQHTEYAAVHVQQTLGVQVERASVRVFPNDHRRFESLAASPLGDEPLLNLDSAAVPGYAGNGHLRELVALFTCDYANPATRFSPSAAYVQVELPYHDPRGYYYLGWRKTDFVVHAFCERASTTEIAQ